MADDHYLPEFYLKPWADSERKLCQFSRPYDRVKHRWVHPCQTGFEPGPNDLPGLGRHYNWLEDKFFREVDQLAYRAHKLLLAGETHMSFELRSAWSRFMMSLLNRAPHRLEPIKKTYRDQINPINPPDVDQATFDLVADMKLAELIKELIDNSEAGAKINDLRWTVQDVGNWPRNILTCDYPVLLSNGLQFDDTFIMTPISPRQIFFATNPSSTLQHPYATSPSEVISLCNKEVVRQAQNLSTRLILFRSIMSKEDCDF